MTTPPMAPTTTRLLLKPNALRCLRCLRGRLGRVTSHGLCDACVVAVLREPDAWPEKPWPHPPAIGDKPQSDAAGGDGYFELWLENELVPFLRDNPRWRELVPATIRAKLPQRFR